MNQQNQSQQNQSEQQEQNKQQTETEAKSRAEHFASLLGENSLLDQDENDEGDEGNEGNEGNEGDEGTQEIKLESLDDLAKSLKMDKAKLYDVKIRLKDDAGEVTLGELKDSYQERGEIDLERIDWGKQKEKQEQQLVEARAEIEVLASLLPKDSLKKESLEAAQKVIKAQVERKRSDLLNRVPEWNDEDIRKSEIEKINEHIKGYGFSFANITDPRIAHFVRNSWLREERIERALARVRPKQKKDATPSGSESGQRRKSAGRKMSPRARHIARNILGQMDD